MMEIRGMKKEQWWIGFSFLVWTYLPDFLHPLIPF